MSDINREVGLNDEQSPVEKFQAWLEKYQAPVMLRNKRWDKWRSEPEHGLLIGLSMEANTVERHYYAPDKYGGYSWYATATFILGEDEKFRLGAINKWGDDLGEQTTLILAQKNIHPRISSGYGGVYVQAQYDRDGNFLYLEGYGREPIKGLDDPEDPSPLWHWQIQRFDIESAFFSDKIVYFPEKKTLEAEKVGENIRVEVNGFIEGNPKILEKALLPVHIDEAEILKRLGISEELLFDPYNSLSGEDSDWKNANLRHVWGVKNESTK